MLRVAILILASALVAVAQSSAVMDDLDGRLAKALTSIPRAETWHAAEQAAGNLRGQVESTLELKRLPAGRTSSALLYIPENLTARVPAVLVLRPHTDPTQLASRSLPSALAQLGMLVVELDLRGDHSNLDLLAHGIPPQGLIQDDVRSALAYLKSNSNVDPSRIALIGEGLAAAMAAAINHEFAVAAILNGFPDFASVVQEIRVPAPGAVIDPCILLPGILKTANSHELAALIGPRPLLVINGSDGPLRYAVDLYRMAGAYSNLSQDASSSWTSSAEFATRRWLARHFLKIAELTDARASIIETPVAIHLRSTGNGGGSEQGAEISEQSPAQLLGPPLLEGQFTHALNCQLGPSVYAAGDKRVRLYAQTKIGIPSTVLRPGPGGCDAARGTLIAVSDSGRSELVSDEIVLEANKRGWIVWMIDPRGIGEMVMSPDAFGPVASLLLGESFSWRQSTDILRVLRHVAGRDSRSPTALYARGKVMGLAASYVAAVAGSRELEWTALRDIAPSFRDMADTRMLMPFSAPPSFDIPDLWRASKGKIHFIQSVDEFVRSDW